MTHFLGTKTSFMWWSIESGGKVSNQVFLRQAFARQRKDLPRSVVSASYAYGSSYPIKLPKSSREIFVVNFELGFFACQLNASSDFLEVYSLSRLCDGTRDCFSGTDENRDYVPCSSKCSSFNKILLDSEICEPERVLTDRDVLSDTPYTDALPPFPNYRWMFVQMCTWCLLSLVNQIRMLLRRWILVVRLLDAR